MTGFRGVRAGAVGLAAMLTAVVACGSDGADGRTAPSTDGSGALGAGDQPSVSASVSATPGRASRRPAPRQIPAEALLQPTDAGNGWTVDPEGPLGDWGMGYTLSLCQSTQWATDRQALGQADRALKDNKNAAVLQSVVSYPVDQATAHFAQWRANLKACADFAGPGGDGQRIKLTVVREGFAGEDSLLIESVAVPDPAGSGPNRSVLVRQDGIVTEVSPTRHTPDSIVQLGKAAASRLCVVANC